MHDRRQRIIKAALEQEGRFTLEDAVLWIGRSYYANERKHTGAVLSGMVKAGLLKREKPGFFVLAKSARKSEAPDLLSLF